MDESINLSQQLNKLLAKIMDNKIYGSLEIYFENGKITQITQRIINKINSQKKDPSEKQENPTNKKNFQKPAIKKEDYTVGSINLEI